MVGRLRDKFPEFVDDVVGRLRDKFPEFVFIALTGSELPAVSQQDWFELLRPPLEPGREKTLLSQFTEAINLTRKN